METGGTDYAEFSPLARKSSLGRNTRTNCHFLSYHFHQADEASQGENTRTDEPDKFTIQELVLPVGSLLPNKAPGHNGISLEIVQKVLQYHSQWLLAMYNHCLRMSCFARIWKRSVAVYFGKPGKESSDPGFYHPICLLPTLGNVLDKMRATRLVLSWRLVVYLLRGSMAFGRMSQYCRCVTECAGVHS